MDENYDLKISGPIKDSLTEYPQYLIEEFLNDNEEGAKYVSCTSIKQIHITCSELSLKKTYRQEWNKDFSFDWDSGEKIVNDELKAKVESLSYERLLGEGIFHDEAIGLFGEKKPFSKANLIFTYLEEDKGFDFFTINCYRESGSISIEFRCKKETYFNLLELSQSKNSKELSILLDLNNVKGIYQEFFEHKHAMTSYDVKLIDVEAYEYLKDEYSEEELEERGITSGYGGIGTQFSITFSNKVGDFAHLEEKISNDLELDEIDTDYLTEEQKLKAEKIVREKALVEAEIAKVKVLWYIFYALIIITLAIVFYG